MREIRMKTISAGPEGVHLQGATRTVSDEEAAALVPDYAEYTDGLTECATVAAPEMAIAAPMETAVVATSETAVKRGRGKR